MLNKRLNKALNKTTPALATLFFALLLIGISKADTQQLEQSFDVEAGGTLYLRSDAGSIEVESHDRNVVEVEVEKKGRDADELEVQITQDGNDIRISAEREGSSWNHSASARFTVKIPTNYNVELKTGGGSIELSDLKGTVNADTSGGSIRLGRIEGDVEVETSGGSIRVDEVAGNIDAHTSGGSIKVKLSQQPTADCRLTTSGGSVVAYLAPGIAVDLDASTSGGRVSSEFDVKGTIKKKRIRGTINGGGPDLVLKTSGGSVSVKEI